jgi:uncharacterized protein (DUF885 family)
MLTRLTLCLCLAVPAFAQSPAPELPAAARSALLQTLFKDIWEDDLKRSPEFASSLGDRRYNDQLSDDSPRSINDALARHRDFLARLLAIDTTGLSDQEKLSSALMQRQLIEDEEAARLKEWELPVNQFHGIHTDLPADVVYFPFDTVKDYDDYIARLHKIPAALRQASENLLSGIDDHRVEPAYILEKALKQTEELAGAVPEASPFALPLKKFPASIDAANRKRISADLLDAIQTDVLPAYVRLAKFLRVTEIPAASPQQTEPQPYHPFNYEIRDAKTLELRAKAQSQLGPKFDLKAFHDTVVSAGALPIDVLEQRVDAWIAASK